MTGASTPKVLIVAALAAETKPLIRYFQLKKDTAFTHFEVFSNPETFLITTGPGKVRSAVGVASFLSASLSASNAVDSFIALNIGIAGAAPQNGFEIGTPFLAHKIVDKATGRTYFPDLLVKSGLAECVLTTVDRPLSMPCDEDLTAGAVDMEGSGFFQAAAAFLPPHQIGCIKIISDYLDAAAVTPGSVSECITACLPAVERATAAYRGSELPRPPLLQKADIDWLKATTDALRLTVTQQRQLEGWTASYRIRNTGALPEIPAMPSSASQNKRERTLRLAALKHILTA